jgi:hypothetical protein
MLKALSLQLKGQIPECQNRRRLRSGIAKRSSGRTGYAKVRGVSNLAFCEEVNWV